jgi:transposase InsO family protein
VFPPFLFAVHQVAADQHQQKNPGAGCTCTWACAGCELLNETLFRSLSHARLALDRWRWDYNPASLHPSFYAIEEKRFC